MGFLMKKVRIFTKIYKKTQKSGRFLQKSDPQMTCFANFIRKSFEFFVLSFFSHRKKSSQIPTIPYNQKPCEKQNTIAEKRRQFWKKEKKSVYETWKLTYERQ